LVVYTAIIVACSIPAARGENKATEQARIDPGTTYQTVAGFGASLAYYEGWLTAHPNKSQIYNAIFKELSLDILRVRNAYGYDTGMIDRVREFAQAAEKSLGKPIDIMVTSWGPPASLKSNNDKSNGGTIKYTVTNGKVEFDYNGFADWWNKSLDNYNTNGIYPKYISIQNEPDWKATYESCLLKPSETINSTDTIAGYNKALSAVYDSVQKRPEKPLLLGPETIGIGYNAVENYVNALDVSKIYGISHHLYHGAEPANPYTSANFAKVGKFHPEKPHFQTEYSTSESDWFSLAGLIYKSFNDENAVAYLYWDLIWTGGGLADLDFPWDRSRWKDPLKGYTLTKEFYAFKQFSAYIHPGWKRASSSLNSSTVKTLAFISAEADTATFVAINLSETLPATVQISIPGYLINQSFVYKTSETKNCEYSGNLADSTVTLEPRSVTTVKMAISQNPNGTENPIAANNETIVCGPNYPNPFSVSTTLQVSVKESRQTWLTVFDSQGRKVDVRPLGILPEGNNRIGYQRKNLESGIYIYKIENAGGEAGFGRFVVRD